MKDITLGQYYPAKSIIHLLDPRVKLLAVILYTCFLFFNDSVIGYAVNIIVLASMIRMTKVPFKQIVKGLKSILFLLLFSVFFTVLFTNGEHLLLHYGAIHISMEGILLAIKICIRIFLLIVMSTILTLSTTPTDIADGLEKSCRILNVIHVPVHEIAMMITIALRFIPILMEETDKIMRAQKARGADFDSGGFIEKAKKLVPIFIPLIVSSVRRSLDLAMAMEARCYRGGEGRTKMKPLVYQKRDKMAYLMMTVYVIVMIMIKIGGDFFAGIW